MIFASWNVNGLRACLNKGNFTEFIQQYDPDVLCLQETKAKPEQVNLDLPQYYIFWNYPNNDVRQGQSGTAVFSNKKPLDVQYGLGIEKHDKEGRVITLEYKSYYLVNCYTPNAQNELHRLDYRANEWDVDFLAYLKELEKHKPVIFCGDLNVAHKEIDIARPKQNRRNPGFTDEERAGFDNIVNSGFIDTFREFESGGGHYTWWSYRANARAKNIGWRIDYFCISPALRKRLKRSIILPEVYGSDHCPIVMELK